MASRVILHIGPQKTASTYLQKTLWLHREALAGFGVNYAIDLAAGFSPAVERKGTVRRNEIAAVVRDPRGPKALAAALAAPGVFVMSDEALSLPPQDTPAVTMAALAAAGAREVELVFVLRRLSERLPSTWSQFVKTGGAEGFVEFCDRLRTMRRPPWTDANILTRWQEAAEAAKLGLRIRLLPLNAIQSHGDDIWRIFATRICGLSGEQVDSLPKRDVAGNPSASAEATEVLRRINAVAKLRGVRMPLSERYDLLAHLSGAGIEPFRAALAAARSEHVLDDNAPPLRGPQMALEPWADAVEPLSDGVRPSVFMPAVRRQPIFAPSWRTVPAARAALERLQAIYVPRGAGNGAGAG